MRHKRTESYSEASLRLYIYIYIYISCVDSRWNERVRKVSSTEVLGIRHVPCEEP